MKKLIIRVVSLLLVMAMICSSLLSCGVPKEEIYTLGKYEIREDHYNYLCSLYKRRIGESEGLLNVDWNETKTSSGSTIADTFDSRYTTEINNEFIDLIYSQLLFDINGLELTEEMYNNIESSVQVLINLYGRGSEQVFDNALKEKNYGFNTQTIREMYIMETKQGVLKNFLFGEDGSKIEKETLDKIYKENYICFNTIVINNKYRILEDGTIEALPDDLVKERNDIIEDMRNLFIEKDDNYEYKVIDSTLTYEQLYQKYSDDVAYPNGCYSPMPSVSQMAQSIGSAITAASLINIGDIAIIDAKRYVKSGTTIQMGTKTETIKPGDYFTYGSVFVKRLPLEEEAYKKEEFATFFTTFMQANIEYLFKEYITDYATNKSPYKLITGDRLGEIKVSDAAFNYVDYEYVYNTDSNSEE